MGRCACFNVFNLKFQKEKWEDISFSHNSGVFGLVYEYAVVQYPKTE